MHESKPTLVLVDSDPTGRLVCLDALRSDFSVQAAELEDQPLRFIRRERPDLVVVVLRSVRIEAVVHLCRRVRSEHELASRLLLWNAPVIKELRRLAEVEDLAHGYLEGEQPPEDLVSACKSVVEGRSVDERHAASGKMGAWMRGLLGS